MTGNKARHRRSIYKPRSPSRGYRAFVNQFGQMTMERQKMVLDSGRLAEQAVQKAQVISAAMNGKFSCTGLAAQPARPRWARTATLTQSGGVSFSCGEFLNKLSGKRKGLFKRLP